MSFKLYTVSRQSMQQKVQVQDRNNEKLHGTEHSRHSVLQRVQPVLCYLPTQ